MKTRKTSFLIIFLSFLLTISINAQQTGKVIFTIQPTNTILKVDGELIDFSKIKQPYEKEMTAGEHKIELWAPRMELQEDILKVVADSTVHYRKGLNVADYKYQAYREARDKYTLRKTIDIALFAPPVFGTAAYLLILNNEKKDFNKVEADVLMRKEEYENAVAEINIAQTKLEYDNAAERYDNAKEDYNKQFIRNTTILAAVYGVSAYFILKRSKNKMEKPTYEPQNPFSNARISIEPGLVNTQQNINFKFQYTF